MAIAMYFNPRSFNAAQYEEVDAALEEAGARTPAARTLHVCFGDGDNLQVFDVWGSQEDFDQVRRDADADSCRKGDRSRRADGRTRPQRHLPVATGVRRRRALLTVSAPAGGEPSLYRRGPLAC